LQQQEMSINLASKNLNSPKNVSRNSPCHCGSNKKYKYCHGKIN